MLRCTRCDLSEGSAGTLPHLAVGREFAGEEPPEELYEGSQQALRIGWECLEAPPLQQAGHGLAARQDGDSGVEGRCSHKPSWQEVPSMQQNRSLLPPPIDECRVGSCVKSFAVP